MPYQYYTFFENCCYYYYTLKGHNASLSLLTILRIQKHLSKSALLWQKEARDIPLKFELLKFSYFT